MVLRTSIRGHARIILCSIVMLSACGARPAIEHDAAVDLPWWAADANAEGWIDDSGQICVTSPTPVLTHRDPRGNYQLTIDRHARIQHAQLGNTRSTDSATAIELDGVAGLALTKNESEARSPISAHQALREAVQANTFFRAFNLRSSGVAGRTCEGDPDIKEALWELRTHDETNPREVRNRLLAIALGRTTKGLPTSNTATGNRFIVKLTLAVRQKHQIVLSAAVVDAARFDKDGGLDSADDLGNGTAIARSSTPLSPTCDTAMASGQGSADIIWVVDESASMEDNREAIIRNTNAFYAKAKAAGLDFRMGVTGMKNPHNTGITGKFCSRKSSKSDDDGGADRFLLPSEQALFQACVRNPPFYEAGDEYGLAAVYEAVERHLPRAENDPSKIRKDAELVIIVVTDEAPQELKTRGHYRRKGGFLRIDEYDSSACFLEPESRDKVDEYLAPWTKMLSGEDNPETRASLHVLGGVCGNRCDAQVAHGYIDLAQKLGGHIGDVCQNDIGATLQVIIDSIVAASSPRILTHRPISGSLAVSIDGEGLSRGRKGGFTYDASQNAISFFDVKLHVGSQIVASYLSYEASVPRR
jgi:hypothetical protein